ncbi:MAG: tRNA uridine-5-carboxymethylaminomethyl(34) synthesis GTPase MnmE [Clostridia bacterium]|nr:tRNA uridine-5-carboxymethylaminomethyl(34) synthesis GTPase MnmE [Clostridia bacterium]
MSDVISAVSTPFGRGGIAVVRISGDGAFAVADKFFKRAGGKTVSEMDGRTVAYGEIFFRGERIDDGCATVFRAPRSFTGEDTVEISCHGGVLVTADVYAASLEAGARPAEAGEFTRRAFVNGRLSLSEAEAVIDLIDAESEDAVKLASGGAAGALGRETEAIREKLIALISAAYVQIDYPDEDLSGLDDRGAADGIDGIIRDIDALLATYRAGHAVMRGIDTVICGSPNVGKSSLLNLLLGRDRAIVAPVAGTTRDTIEEKCAVGRVTLNLCDTAGIRESDDEVEMLGIGRTREKLENCELTIAVFDSSRPLSADDNALISLLDPAKTVIVLNKCDLPAACPRGIPGFDRLVRLSCVTGEGADRLKEVIEGMYIDGDIDYSRATVTNARQKAALDRARSLAASAASSLAAGATADVAGMDLELAAAALGEVDGRSVSEQVVDGIFSRFCVGK